MLQPMLQPVDTIMPPAKVLASAADGIVPLIKKNQGDVDRIFGRARISTDDLENPQNELNLSQYCQLFDEAAKQTGNDNFGLQFGADYHPKRLGALGYAAISSPTLRSALHRMEAYFPAHQSQSIFRISQADGDLMWLDYRVFDERIKNLRQDAELSICIFLNFFRHALGKDWTPVEIGFEHTKPDNSEEHHKLFNAPVKFNRSSNRIGFRKKDLDTVMPEQDPYLYTIVESFLKTRSEMCGDSVDFAAMAREQIKLNLYENQPRISTISESLGLSELAFKKQLASRQLTFQDLLRAARQELALHYLQDDDIPLTDLAMRIGYSELSAFSRAFRSWTGISPQQYRRSQIDC